MQSTLFEKTLIHDGSLAVTNYSPQEKLRWDLFVSQAKNGVFLFYRDYMEYHKDRFTDHSLLFLRNGRLEAILPANIKNGVLYSHGGLTFGGFVSKFDATTSGMLRIFDALLIHCQTVGIKKVVYKPEPYIYSLTPSGEDLYALSQFDAKLIARKVSSCIYLQQMQKFNDNRKDNLRKANKNNLVVAESLDFDSFMDIAQQTLAKRHGVKPVHTTQEIKLLAKRFPSNIKLFASFKNRAMVAGIVMYESRNVAHMQYAANSEEGRSLGAQDIIEDYLINEYYRDKKYFDFGVSTENQGEVLNEGLIKRKEYFGASAVVYDQYQLDL